MVHAATLGLPLSLKNAAQVLNQDAQKMQEGVRLIRPFSTPDKEGHFTEPNQDLEGWLLFKQYNAQDVEVERSLQRRFAKFALSTDLWQEYWLDQTINDRGIRVDLDFAKRGALED